MQNIIWIKSKLLNVYFLSENPVCTETQKLDICLTPPSPPSPPPTPNFVGKGWREIQVQRITTTKTLQCNQVHYTLLRFYNLFGEGIIYSGKSQFQTKRCRKWAAEFRKCVEHKAWLERMFWLFLFYPWQRWIMKTLLSFLSSTQTKERAETRVSDPDP